MKKTKSILAGFAMLALTACGTLGTGDTSGIGNILGSVLGAATDGQTIGNILTSVIGLDKPSQADLIGTWQYRQPGAAFTSENLLAKAGGEVAATTVKEKLASYYNGVGIKSSNTVLQFTQDGQFAGKVAGKSISGTYTYDPNTCQIQMKTLFFTLPAYAKKTTTGMSILFESKKLLSVLQTLAAISGNSSLQTIGDLSKNYDGVRIGFDMSR
ncbi:MAG: DUF4923 family protein [Prevotella sp.]|nr:DUF4923 family protein [Prevotella sp.]